MSQVRQEQEDDRQEHAENRQKLWEGHGPNRKSIGVLDVMVEWEANLGDCVFVCTATSTQSTQARAPPTCYLVHAGVAELGVDACVQRTNDRCDGLLDRQSHRHHGVLKIRQLRVSQAILQRQGITGTVDGGERVNDDGSLQERSRETL